MLKTKDIEKDLTHRIKYNFIDVLRVIACFLVIVNHTNSEIFLGSKPSLTWYVSLTYFFVCKIAVPLFIMISGFTMLGRVDSYSKIGKKILRIILALVLFSLLYYCDLWQSGYKPNAGVVDYFLSVFQVQQTNAFWYLYMYIGILIMLPYLQKMVIHLSKRDIQIFIGISLLVTGTWPIIVHYIPSLSYCNHLQLPLFNGYIGLLLIGYYFKTYIVHSKKNLMISIVVFIVSVAVNVVMTRYEYNIMEGNNYLFFDNRLYLPVVLASISFFNIVYHIKVEGIIAKVVKVLSECSFGIYLLSDFLISKLIWIWNDLCVNGMHPIIAIVIFEFVVFGIGFIITFILKKVPGIKRVL